MEDQFLILLMGPNGVGKTTFGNQLKDFTHINLDEMVMNKINPSFIEKLNKDANNEQLQSTFLDKFDNFLAETSIEYYNKCVDIIKEGKNLSLEANTLPGPYSDTKSIMNYAVKNGYQLNLLFIASNNLDFIKERVLIRTMLSGQFVDEKLIISNLSGGFKDLDNVLSNRASIRFNKIAVFEIDFSSEENNKYVKVIDIDKNTWKYLDKNFVKEYKDYLPTLVNR